MSLKRFSYPHFKKTMDSFGPYEKNPKIAIAVSGGLDSMLLAKAVQQWAKEKKGQVFCLTVDHGLRLDSFKEAKQVGCLLKDEKIEHHILRWKGKKPATGIQEKARKARYELLYKWCQKQGVMHLLTAHHHDDQIETLLMRSEKGSGKAGLSGIAPLREGGYTRLLRPLLSFPKKALQDELIRREGQWIEDPTNALGTYERNRRRQFLKTASGQKKALKLLETLKENQKERENKTKILHQKMARAVRLHKGYLTFCHKEFLSMEMSTQVKFLERVTSFFGGGEYPLPKDLSKRVINHLKSVSSAKLMTAGKCLFKQQSGEVFVCCEKNRNEVEVVDNKSFIWNRVYQISPSKWDKNLLQKEKILVKQIGHKGWQEVLQKHPELKKINIPSFVRETFPSLWKSGELIAVAYLGGNQSVKWQKFEASISMKPFTHLAETAFT